MKKKPSGIFEGKKSSLYKTFTNLMENKEKKQKKKLPKGVCPSCWGKGFYTQMYGIRGYPDFPGDKGFEEKPSIHKKVCPDCKGTGKKAELSDEPWKGGGADEVIEKLKENKIEEWEERFDKLGITFTSDINRSICKQFIRQVRQEAKEEGRKEALNNLLCDGKHPKGGCLLEKIQEAKEEERERIVKRIRERWEISIDKDLSTNYSLVPLEYIIKAISKEE